MLERALPPFSLLLLLASCSPDLAPDLDACPPAPLRYGLPTTFEERPSCDFEETCTYARPLGLGYTYTDYCNGLQCACRDGRFSCRSTLVACSPHIVHECPSGAAEGAACAEDTNRECAVPGPGADLSQGIIDGFVCACDEPGPIWRCLPVESTSL